MGVVADPIIEDALRGLRGEMLQVKVLKEIVKSLEKGNGDDRESNELIGVALVIYSKMKGLHSPLKL
jgi:hypothetical protein